jgi:hypothetical protein
MILTLERKGDLDQNASRVAQLADLVSLAALSVLNEGVAGQLNGSPLLK